MRFETEEAKENPSDFLNGVEVHGGDGADAITGGTGESVLDGGRGNDLLTGRGDHDTFLASSHRDGADTLVLQSGSGSLVDYTRRRRPVRLSLDEHRNDGEEGEHDRLVSRGAGVTLAGGRGADRLYAGRNYHRSPAEFNGVSLIGNRGADVLVGNSAANSLYADGNERGALRDRDRLYGRGGSDLLYGNSGPNLLDGGAGPDLVWAGAGADLIRLRGRDLDGVSCGAGHDRARLDALDSLSSRASCERIDRGSSAIATFDAFSESAGSSREVLADERRFYVDIACPTDAGRRCRGQVLMRYRSTVLARGSFSIHRGGDGQPTLKLTRAGIRKFVDGGAYIKTTLEIRSHDRWGRLRISRVGGWLSYLQGDV